MYQNIRTSEWRKEPRLIDTSSMKINRRFNVQVAPKKLARDKGLTEPPMHVGILVWR